MDQRRRRAGPGRSVRFAHCLLLCWVLAAGCSAGGSAPPLGATSARPLVPTVPCLSTVRDGPFAECIELTLTFTWNLLFGASRRDYTPPMLVAPDSAPPPDPAVAHRAYYSPRSGVHVPVGYLDDLRTAHGDQAHAALAFALAHETGHHVQSLLHPRETGSDGVSQQDAVSRQVEMQADCYAGVWAHAEQAAGLLDRGGFLAVARAELSRLSTATTGGADPAEEVRTHGTAEQRADALTRGLDSGDPAACDLGELTWAR